MTTLTQNIIHTTKIVILALTLAFGISLVHAAWVGPTSSPPGNNTPAPVNVGSDAQTKFGILGALEFVTLKFTGNEYCVGGDCVTQWPEEKITGCDGACTPGCGAGFELVNTFRWTNIGNNDIGEGAPQHVTIGLCRKI